MTKIRASDLRNSSILRVYSIRQYIQTNPDYQRMGEIWTIEKRQLFIDSIINDFDIPKLYFHEFPEYKIVNGEKIKYAIIDGRQRLETIWDFIDGKFSLSKECIYFDDNSIVLSGLTYGDLATKYPELKSLFDSYALPIITVTTEDIDMIEEMFSRLNEAIPLNSAEKRNALGGPLVPVIRGLAKHKFFKQNVAFSNKRYQHMEVDCKFLWLTYSKKIIDTKKVYLDFFVKDFKRRSLSEKSKSLERQVLNVLNEMSKIFTIRDSLLRTMSMPVIYYLVFKDATDNNWLDKITREKLITFEKAREQNRITAAEDISKAKYEFLEFDRMAQQGTNDGVSINFRVTIMKSFLLGEE